MQEQGRGRGRGGSLGRFAFLLVVQGAGLLLISWPCNDVHRQLEETHQHLRRLQKTSPFQTCLLAGADGSMQRHQR